MHSATSNCSAEYNAGRQGFIAHPNNVIFAPLKNKGDARDSG